MVKDLGAFINMKGRSPMEARCPRPNEVLADISSIEGAIGVQFQLNCYVALVKRRRTAEMFEWFEEQEKQYVDNCSRNSC